jgi:hypothetical protein
MNSMNYIILYYIILLYNNLLNIGKFEFNRLFIKLKLKL